MHIKVMADYHCHPLWWDQGSNKVGNVDPREIGLSTQLSDQLYVWAIDYDCTLNDSDPLSSGFLSPQAKHHFVERGAELSKLISDELGPSAVVRYFPLGY